MPAIVISDVSVILISCTRPPCPYRLKPGLEYKPGLQYKPGVQYKPGQLGVHLVPTIWCQLTTLIVVLSRIIMTKPLDYVIK